MHQCNTLEPEASALPGVTRKTAAHSTANGECLEKASDYLRSPVDLTAPDASLKIFFSAPLAALQHSGYMNAMLRRTISTEQPRLITGAIVMATPKTAAKSAAQTADKAAKTIETETTKANAQTEDFMFAVQDQFQSAMNSFADKAETMRVQAEDSFHTMRENTEKTAERFQAVNSEVVAAARDEMADAVDFVNELGRAKTMTDAFDIQRTYWTNLFETRVERARKITETTVEATQDSMKPFNDTMATAFDTSNFEKLFPFATR